MSDAPIGVLLSGGLDSSLISAIAVRKMRSLGLTLRSFSIGLDADAPDLVAARGLARFLGTEHHEFHFSVQASGAKPYWELLPILFRRALPSWIDSFGTWKLMVIKSLWLH